MDEVRLLERVRHGDETAFAELFQRHRAIVYRYALHMIGAENADDVVQEVFLAVLQQLDRFDPARGELRAYLLGIARRQALKRAAPGREEQWDDASTLESGDAVPDPTEAVDRAETVERVRAAIAALPPAYREAVVLCELNELDYAAAALVMKCPVGTVRSRLHRARALLASKLAATRDAPAARHAQ